MTTQTNIPKDHPLLKILVACEVIAIASAVIKFIQVTL